MDLTAIPFLKKGDRSIFGRPKKDQSPYSGATQELIDIALAVPTLEPIGLG